MCERTRMSHVTHLKQIKRPDFTGGCVQHKKGRKLRSCIAWRCGHTMSHEAPTQNVSQSQRCQRLVAVTPSTSLSHTLLRATSCGFVLHQRGLATSSIHRCSTFHVLYSTTRHLSIRYGDHQLCSPTDFITNPNFLRCVTT